FRVSPALARGDRDRSSELRKELAALGVRGGLLMLDGGPFGVAGHADESTSGAQLRPGTPVLNKQRVVPAFARANQGEPWRRLRMGCQRRAATGSGDPAAAGAFTPLTEPACGP